MSGRMVEPSSMTSRPWQDTLHTSSNALSFLLSSGTHSDVTLVVGRDGRQFKVHRLILAMRSQVFEEMLMLDSNNIDKSVIVLKGNSYLPHIKCIWIETNPVNLVILDLALINKGITNKFSLVDYLWPSLQSHNETKFICYTFVNLQPDDEEVRFTMGQIFEHNALIVFIFSTDLIYTVEVLQNQSLHKNLWTLTGRSLRRVLRSQYHCRRSSMSPRRLRHLWYKLPVAIHQLGMYVMRSKLFFPMGGGDVILRSKDSTLLVFHVARVNQPTSPCWVNQPTSPLISRSKDSTLLGVDKAYMCWCHDAGWLETDGFEYRLSRIDSVNLVNIRIYICNRVIKISTEVHK
ncbi:unnamed protein product, partial [Meganyctiphanes norvegica]